MSRLLSLPTSCADFQAHTAPCWHANAARDLSQAEYDWLADLSDDDLYERINDVVIKCHVAIIHTNSNDKSALVLTISIAESGWPRSIVGALKDGSLCRERRST